MILPEHLPPSFAATGPRQLQRQGAQAEDLGRCGGEALEQAGGHPGEAARSLGVSRATLYRHLPKEAKEAGGTDYEAASPGGASSGGPSSAGKYTLKVVPLPTSLHADAAAALLDDGPAGRQSQAGAFASGFVVKNGSNRRALTSSVHARSRVADGEQHVGVPGATPACGRALVVQSGVLLVVTVSLPPSGMASRALTTRFSSTCPR